LIADLVGIVMLLLLTGVFALLVSPIVLLLLWLNRKILADHRAHSPRRPVYRRMAR